MDWAAPRVRTGQGEPTFDDVVNPFGASPFVYRPVFEKTGDKKYLHHELPGGGRPPPMNSEGKRSVDGWIWDASGETKMRSSGLRFVTRDNPFPDERKGSLDAVMLENMGLTKERMRGCDALFFYQLLLPICDPMKSGIACDPRKPFYTENSKYTNGYAFSELGLDGTYGHRFDLTNARELLQWDGIQLMHGTLGGGNPAKRWDKGRTTFCEYIDAAMTHTRFLQLKRTRKLCDNKDAPKRGQVLQL